ncbi:unnamed protein product [Sympodiomycopsis kandeliae]
MGRNQSSSHAIGKGDAFFRNKGIYQKRGRQSWIDRRQVFAKHHTECHVHYPHTPSSNTSHALSLAIDKPLDSPGLRSPTIDTLHLITHTVPSSKVSSTHRCR